MERKRINRVEETYTLEDLKNYLVGETGKNVSIEPVYKTEIIPGYDPHDADYVEVLVGIKISYEDVGNE